MVCCLKYSKLSAKEAVLGNVFRNGEPTQRKLFLEEAPIWPGLVPDHLMTEGSYQMLDLQLVMSQSLLLLFHILEKEEEDEWWRWAPFA